MEEFDKEQFLKDIKFIPNWVKNPEDMKTFCAHLQYRLKQKTEVLWWIFNNVKMEEPTQGILDEIFKKYDDAYNKNEG
jgi:hypothetical protein